VSGFWCWVSWLALDGACGGRTLVSSVGEPPRAGNVHVHATRVGHPPSRVVPGLGVGADSLAVCGLVLTGLAGDQFVALVGTDRGVATPTDLDLAGLGLLGDRDG